jgi:hypothetical protein
MGRPFGSRGRGVAEIMAGTPEGKLSEVRDEPNMRVPPVRGREGTPGNGSGKG